MLEEALPLTILIAFIFDFASMFLPEYFTR